MVNLIELETKRGLNHVNYPIKDTLSLNIDRLDPFGFWKVSLTEGELPSRLQGQFTSLSEAEKVVIPYVREAKQA